MAKKKVVKTLVVDSVMPVAKTGTYLNDIPAGLIEDLQLGLGSGESINIYINPANIEVDFCEKSYSVHANSLKEVLSLLADLLTYSKGDKFE